ncbi:MAG: SDR family NAD(P)-dependent oxidoreductase [Bacteroidales bacterium]|nr:SDR family NAD(P)-dependent oxidoreductase [Bacteroidales bacterium]
MKSKTILVTGATDGIGKQTAFELAQKGHKVIVHGRNKDKSETAAREIRAQTGSDKIETVSADLTDLHAIERMSSEVRNTVSQLDVLINNAGVFENDRIILPNGFEKTFMINHLAPFALTLQLLGLLRATPNARIVNVSSMAQSGSIDFDNLNGEKYFDGYNAYAVSKLENVLFTYKLARLLDEEEITVNCLHPGVIKTKLLHAGWGMGGANLHDGAATSLYAALAEELEGKTGLYLLNRNREMRSSAISYDQKIQNRLWEISLSLTGLSY